MSIALFLLNLLFSPQTPPIPPVPARPVVFTVVAPPALEPRPITVPSTSLARLPQRLPHYTVTATVYTPEVEQTDDEPFVTADNSRIPQNHSSKTRWIALSRDLLQRWGGPLNYGDAVRISGISPSSMVSIRCTTP
ncbi:hypothetical protein LRS06_10350 [Hymenobacter sp. J193]|uniref:hypothetical protein n=1 Tax=Hymenobacter sp. J193 TaxID=2898429 RepID=UPI002150D5B3|nr:hypothetical protein [Hymenobacter sp. J193]MCR5888163.1 hypothetical protein [Hymenobacter sp. J193]